MFMTLFALVLLTACATVPLTGRKQVAFMNDGELTLFSNDEYDKTLRSNKLSTDKKQTEMIKRVGSRVSKAVERYLSENGMSKLIRDYDWEFNLIESDSVNAWCMPGGKVAFYTGILPITQNEIGVAVVMGHEIAHAVARHGNERMSKGLIAQGLNTLMMVALSASDISRNH